MATEVELILRSPEAYRLARSGLDLMAKHKVWPTPLNFELWLHYVCDPHGALASEIDRLVESGQPITEAVSEGLASAYLPKAKLNEEIRDAGDQLSRELETVSRAIQAAQKTSRDYGVTLAGASDELARDGGPVALDELVGGLATATQRVQHENKVLEKRLHESTSEVSRLKKHLEQVRRDARTDALTNLANRKAFDMELERCREEAQATGRAVTLAILDIDHFKRFNDTWGHQTGDQVLRFVASVIGREARAPRFAARYGGEEFAVLFPGETGDMATPVLQHMLTEIASRVLRRRSTNEELGMVSVSAGLAQLLPGETGQNVLARADAALYASKKAGRNCVTSAPAQAVEDVQAA
jgi:diguanylate cyclase